VDGALRVDGTGAPDAWWQVAATAGWAHLDTTGTAADVSAVLPPGSVGVE
jgi:hypothetical protein